MIINFWHRPIALLIDCLILASIGVGLGLIFENQFILLGDWAKLIGFLVALAYFGVMNSKYYGGQTLGKKILKIKVIGANKEPISFTKSCLRFSILAVPFFLKDANFVSQNTSYWSYFMLLIMVSSVMIAAYLYVFNQITRQSLHDLIVKTYVVKINSEQQAYGDIWKNHFFISGGLFIIAIILVSSFHYFKNNLLTELIATQHTINRHSLVSYSKVSFGLHDTVQANQQTHRETSINLQVFLTKNLIANENFAREIAKILLSNYQKSWQKDQIQVVLIYGYDIGITNKWRRSVYSFKRNEYKEIRKIKGSVSMPLT